MRLWIGVRSFSNQDAGVFALLTLVFFLVCGISAVFILWGIAQATGMYNAAFYATQSAARAAAGTATADGSGGWQICKDVPGALNESNFDCGLPSGGGEEPAAVAAAKQSLNASLNRNTLGNFGLVSAYGSNIPSEANRLFIQSTGQTDNAISVYNVPPSKGADAQRYGCRTDSGVSFDRGFINYPPARNPGGGNGSGVGCWSVKEYINGQLRQVWPWQYQSGVVVRTRTELGFPLNCNTSSTAGIPCIILPIVVKGAARVVTNDQPRNYESYLCYGFYRDFESDDDNPDLADDGSIGNDCSMQY